MDWSAVSSDVVQIFIDYFMVRDDKTCDKCQQMSSQVSLRGLLWLCLQCSARSDIWRTPDMRDSMDDIADFGGFASD